MKLTPAALVVLRMIRGNGGQYLSTSTQKRLADHLSALGYATKLKSGYRITSKGSALLDRTKRQNPYGDVGAW